MSRYFRAIVLGLTVSGLFLACDSLTNPRLPEEPNDDEEEEGEDNPGGQSYIPHLNEDPLVV